MLDTRYVWGPKSIVFLDASNGALFSEDKTLEKLLGRPTAGLDVAVKQALAH